MQWLILVHFVIHTIPFGRFSCRHRVMKNKTHFTGKSLSYVCFVLSLNGQMKTLMIKTIITLCV